MAAVRALRCFYVVVHMLRIESYGVVSPVDTYQKSRILTIIQEHATIY